MKKLALLVLLAELAVCGCGSGNSANTVNTTANGNWEATMTGGIGQASLLDFVTAFSVENTGPLDITGFGFFNANSCFDPNPSVAGTANLTTGSTSNVTGTLTYTVQSSGSTLTLTGTITGTASNSTVTNGVVVGTWTLSGGNGCSGTGDFTMCQNTTTCSATTT